jgi:hypothetical protein
MIRCSLKPNSSLSSFFPTQLVFEHLVGMGTGWVTHFERGRIDESNARQFPRRVFKQQHSSSKHHGISSTSGV